MLFDLSKMQFQTEQGALKCRVKDSYDLYPKTMNDNDYDVEVPSSRELFFLLQFHFVSFQSNKTYKTLSDN